MMGVMSKIDRDKAFQCLEDNFESDFLEHLKLFFKLFFNGYD